MILDHRRSRHTQSPNWQRLSRAGCSNCSTAAAFLRMQRGFDARVPNCGIGQVKKTATNDNT